MFTSCIYCAPYVLQSVTINKYIFKTPSDICAEKKEKNTSICCNWQKRMAGLNLIFKSTHSPWICLTLFGWGLCREKNEGWLNVPNRGLLVVRFLVNSAVNGTWMVWLWLLAPVVARECGVRAIDISWNHRRRFYLNLREFKKKTC